VELYAYLRHVFEKLPLVQTVQNFKDLLPKNVNPESIAVNA
jgi:hypothetical protein